MNMQQESALMNLVRVGSVSSVDTRNRTARVIFFDKQDVDDNPLISAELKIIINNHSHQWMPSINQLVVCLYIPNGDSDGIILGGI